MDLNPKQFQAPWDAFEFGRHCVAAEAEVVVVPMAWLKGESEEEGAKGEVATEPENDLRTLQYWLMRLDPVLRLRDGKSRLFIACNRTDDEGETVYAGSSAVCRITDGRIDLLGHLGREEDLLVVEV